MLMKILPVGASCSMQTDGQADLTKLTVVLHNLRTDLKAVYFRCIIISHIILEFLPRCIIHINCSPSTGSLLYLATSICYFNPLFHRACEQWLNIIH